MDGGWVAAEPAGPRAAIKDAVEFLRAGVTAAEHPAGTLFGIGAQIARRLEVLERRTSRSLGNMQPNFRFNPYSYLSDAALDSRSRRRRVQLRLAVSPRSVALNPLLDHLFPGRVLVGPVPIRALIIDDRLLLVEGPATVDDEPTAWLVRDRAYVEAAQVVWECLHAVGSLRTPPADPLSSRQLAAAALLCQGRTYRQIASALRVSVRSVDRDVARVVEVVGADSVAGAITRILGRAEHLVITGRLSKA